MERPLRVLLVEDDEDDALLMLRELRRGGFLPEWRRVFTADDLRAALAAQDWDIMLCDHNMPGFDSTAAVALARQCNTDVPIIIVSGSIGEDVAVSAMRAGVQDYVIKDKLARLAPAVEREVREAIERRARRRAEAALHAREEEFRIGREIQQRLFPAAAPILPGLDIGGASFPAAATGGDYFDYLRMAGGALGVVVSDVSGHGIGPALLMADTRAYLRTLASSFTDPVDILSRLNALLLEDLGEDRFVTVLFATICPEPRRLAWLSAGHPSGYVLDRGGAVRHELTATLPALGLMPLTLPIPAAESLPLEPGDILLLLTDGVTEAVSPRGEEFGAGRALQTVAAHRGEPAARIVQALCAAVSQYSEGRAQADDITAMVVKITAKD
jgi:serine phosphatase RsbU (regulator of sigma subunit)